MNVTANSTLSWMDSSEQERRTVLDLVSALNEPGTLDELGIGTIRDTFADALFPGTSTIQTRSRYFLFIPWILQMVERRPTSDPERRARELQLQLCNALDRAHGASEGVIGREAGAALQRWPISIYWLGLSRWGIRRYPGPLSSYFTRLRRPTSWLTSAQAIEEQVEERRFESLDNPRGNWSDIPKIPEGFPDEATFDLTTEEAQFLSEQVVLNHPHTYLAHLLKFGGTANSNGSDFPWQHPAAPTSLPGIQAWLYDARLFSLVHQGATLLYNHTLADSLEDEERVEAFSDRLDNWSGVMASSASDLKHWDRAEMWGRMKIANPRIRASARDFTERWYRLAVNRIGTSIDNDPEAKALIRNREHALKGRRSRLTYTDARHNRQGYPISGRLQFRWPQAQRITDDILQALEPTHA